MIRYACIALLGLALSVPADAKSFTSGRSSFSSSSFRSSAPRPVYKAPAPAAPVARPITVNRTAVVQQTVVQRAPASSATGGFFSGLVGGMAGAGIVHWLTKPSTPEPRPAVDCNTVSPQMFPKECEAPK